MAVAKEKQKFICFQGMADASAAVALDDEHFVVASDEQNIFQMYSKNQTTYLDEFKFSHFLNLPKHKQEADIEASATLQGVTYWIGSHGRNGEGKLRMSRHQLFATTQRLHHGDFVVRQIGNSYTGLALDLLHLPEFRKATDERLDPELAPTLAPKHKGALNIEGLTSWEDGLLIGFRNPIPQGKALFVPILNPLLVVTKGAHAELGEPFYLDLNGHGVRSIDYWAERNTYIISSGPYDGGHDFEFFLWDGDRKSVPKKINSSEVKGLNAEAVVTFPDEDKKVLVLSDDGAETIDGINAKETGNKDRECEFRAGWLTIPD